MNPAETIRAMIGSGEENAVQSKTLEEVTGLNGRDVKRCIEELRRGGTVICGSNRGYFYPEQLHELQGFIKRELRRAASIRRTLESAEALFDKWNELQNR